MGRLREPLFILAGPVIEPEDASSPPGAVLVVAVVLALGILIVIGWIVKGSITSFREGGREKFLWDWEIYRCFCGAKVTHRAYYERGIKKVCQEHSKPGSVRVGVGKLLRSRPLRGLR